MMVSTRRMNVDPYKEESEEQRHPPLPVIMETTGGPIFLE